MRGSSAGVALLASVLLLAVAAPARADNVINLGNIIPNAINGHRQIVGGSGDPAGTNGLPTHAELWSGGILTRLHEPADANQTDAYAINASGRIAGDSVTGRDGGNTHAVYWDGANGTPIQLGPVSLNSGNVDYSSANGVDDAGDVVGTTVDENAKPDTGAFGFFSSRGNGSITRVAPGFTNVDGITPNGQTMLGQVLANENRSLTGFYLWPAPGASGTQLDLQLFAQGSNQLGGATVPQYGSDLASDGTVLGYKGANPSAGTWYIRLPNGSETRVTGLLGHNAVNAKHTVVGAILGTYQGQQIAHAALWTPDTGMIDLNSLLPANSDYVLSDALAINDNGDIVGIAGQISTHTQVGFLLPAGFVVDSTGDEDDNAPGDGNCLTAADTCTLRAALQEVNAAKVTTPTAINFSLPGGSGTILPASPLPAAQFPIELDGGTHVILEGAGAGDGAAGLTLQGDDSTVRGMEIDGFRGAGVTIQASNVIVGGLPTATPACAFPCNTFKDEGGPAVAVASGNKNQIRGNRMIGGARPAIDLGADGRTPNDAKDADTGADGLHNFPIGVLGERDPVTKVMKVSGVDQAADVGDVIEVYAQSAVSAARGAEPTYFVGSTNVGYMGGWSIDVPSGVPAGADFFSAAVTTAAEGTSELSPVCGDPDGDGNPDSDGDGLCDDWETTGIDADDDGKVDLTLPGASPAHKDLYLEIDAMRSQVPSQGAIDDVVQAFAKAPVENASGGTGVALHATLDETVPDVARFDVGGTGPGTLDGIREGSLSEPCDGDFGTHEERAAKDCFQQLAARDLAYRWALFGINYSEEVGSSGFAAGLGGKTLTVTLGGWGDDGIINGGGGAAQCHTLADCRRVADAGTLMHEFGHSLGLHHGGRDDTQFKPNYLSVMNYMFQMRGRVRDRPLDYSRWALPPLDETNLTDSAGIGGSADVAAEWPHTGYYFNNGQYCVVKNGATSGPIDWDGSLATLTASFITHDKYCGTTTPPLTQTVLTSTADWPDLRYSFRDQEGGSDAPSYQGDTDSPEETSTDLLTDLAHSDADGNGVNDLADGCRVVAGSDFADANGNGFADVCEPTMNQLQAFPGQQNGSGSGGGGAAGGGGSAAPAGGPAKDTTAPTLSKLSAKRAKKAKTTTLRFSVSEASTVTFTGEQVLKGRKHGKTCVARGKTGKACSIYKKTGGSLRVNAKAGAVTATFAGKLGTKKLGKGTYRLTAVAIDAAGNRSKLATVTVTVG